MDKDKFILYQIEENFNDYETLEIGTKIIEMAKERLNNDLDNKEINAEYNKLNDIIGELQEILKNYK